MAKLSTKSRKALPKYRVVESDFPSGDNYDLKQAAEFKRWCRDILWWFERNEIVEIWRKPPPASAS